MADEQPQAPQGQPEPQVTPAPAPQEAVKPPEAPSENKFAGKTPEELAKSYQELEKKLGDQSNELGEHRKYREQMDLVLQAIWSDPTLYSTVDQQIRKLQGGGQARDTSQPNGEASFAINDTRAAMERKIINDFEKEFGIDKLSTEDKQKAHAKVGQALRDLVDPNGSRTTTEILSSISLEKLPAFLENAFFVSNKETFLQEQTKRREAELGAIGSIPSSGGSSSELSLNDLERKAAQGMGIPEDKYKERKKQLLEERNKES